MSDYRHPILLHERRTQWGHTGIADLGARTPEGKQDPEAMFALQQGETTGYQVIEVIDILNDFDSYMHRFKGNEQLRIGLGIPVASYHAYGFPYKGYNVDHLIALVEFVRQQEFEIRIWVIEESALLLVAFVDPDTSPFSGWKVYEWVQKNIEYKSYGMSSWFEFCAFGVPVEHDWELVDKGGVLFAEDPNSEKVVMFG